MSVPLTTLEMKSPLGAMLTLSLFTVIKDRRCSNLKWAIFLVLKMVGEIPMFFLREREKKPKKTRHEAVEQ